MLQHRVIPSARPWRSVRLASQLGNDPTGGQRPLEATATTSSNSLNARKPPSILSRLSDRTQSCLRRDADIGPKNPTTRAEVAAAANGTPRPRATSFVSARSAQKRDHAVEKWFTDVREVDVSNVGQPDDLILLRRKRRGSGFSKQHEMRPKTDLSALFAPTATSLRVQTKKELGGDYTGYLPDEHADPRQLPITYARLFLGRNKHIPLSAQTAALNIIEGAIRGERTKQVV